MEEQAMVRAPADDETLLSKAKILARYGVSDTCIARWRADPRVRFPPPDLRINNRWYWRAVTLRRFEVERAEAETA